LDFFFQKKESFSLRHGGAATLAGRPPRRTFVPHWKTHRVLEEPRIRQGREKRENRAFREGESEEREREMKNDLIRPLPPIYKGRRTGPVHLNHTGSVSFRPSPIF